MKTNLFLLSLLLSPILVFAQPSAPQMQQLQQQLQPLQQQMEQLQQKMQPIQQQLQQAQQQQLQQMQQQLQQMQQQLQQTQQQLQQTQQQLAATLRPSPLQPTTPLQSTTTTPLQPTNVALRKPTTSSSIYKATEAVDKGASGEPSKAVDGNTSQVFSQNSMALTNVGPNQFWQVDLAGNFKISNIRIFNRTDCCSERIVGATLQILGQDGKVVAQTMINQSSPAYDIPIAQMASTTGGVGRFVRIISAPKADNYLQLAEVEVYGIPN